MQFISRFPYFTVSNNIKKYLQLNSNKDFMFLFFKIHFIGIEPISIT